MGLTMNSVVVSSGFAEVSLDVDVPPQAASESRPIREINEKWGALSIYSY
jgi:hypothetical protein